MTCEITAQAWDGIIPGLLANRFDVIIGGMAMTPARRERVAFSNQYRRIISSFFIARRGAFTDISPQALRGRRIGVQRGASQHVWLQREGYERSSTLVLYDTVNGPELDLIAGRVDLIVMNKITAHLGLMNWPEARNSSNSSGPNCTAASWGTAPASRFAPATPASSRASIRPSPR